MGTWHADPLHPGLEIFDYDRAQGDFTTVEINGEVVVVCKRDRVIGDFYDDVTLRSIQFTGETLTVTADVDAAVADLLALAPDAEYLSITIDSMPFEVTRGVYECPYLGDNTIKVGDFDERDETGTYSISDITVERNDSPADTLRDDGTISPTVPNDAQFYRLLRDTELTWPGQDTPPVPYASNRQIFELDEVGEVELSITVTGGTRQVGATNFYLAAYRKTPTVISAESLMCVL